MKIMKATSLIGAIVLSLVMSLSASAAGYTNCPETRELIEYFDYSMVCHDIIKKRERHDQSVTSNALSSYWQCESMMTNYNSVMTAFDQLPENEKMACAKLHRGKFVSSFNNFDQASDVLVPYIEGKK